MFTKRVDPAFVKEFLLFVGAFILKGDANALV